MTRSLVRSNPSELRLMELENMLRMVDHLALTRDGIHFNTQQGRHWVNDVFQTQLMEMEQELRTTSSLARTSSTGGGRVRGNVPESLANRLGPLATENGCSCSRHSKLRCEREVGDCPSSQSSTVGEPTWQTG